MRRTTGAGPAAHANVAPPVEAFVTRATPCGVYLVELTRAARAAWIHVGPERALLVSVPVEAWRQVSVPASAQFEVSVAAWVRAPVSTRYEALVAAWVRALSPASIPCAASLRNWALASRLAVIVSLAWQRIWFLGASW